MDEAGRRHTEREYASSLIGYKNVDSIFPIGDRDQMPTNARSFAMLENNDFREGSYVPAGSDQLHTIHLDIHLDMLSKMVESYDQPQQGKAPDLEGILRTFAAALPNVEEHIKFISQDESRKDYVKRAMLMLRELVIFYRRVEQDAAKGREAEDKLALERQQQVIAETEQRMNLDMSAKMREVELKAQIEAMKQDSLAQVRFTKTEAQNDIKRMGAEMRAQLDRDMAERRMALDEEMSRRKQELAEQTKGK